MTFSTGCACNFVPLLARIVLGAAFITAGYQKVFDSTEYTGDNAAALRELGVEAAEPGTARGPLDQQWMLHTIAFEQEPAGGGQGLGNPAQDDPQEEQDPTDDPGQPAEPDVDRPGAQGPGGPGTSQRQPAESGTVRAKKAYGVAIVLHDRFGGGEIDPKWFRWAAWATAITELAGGVLILIGLFSRLWGLALAIVMLGAIYLTSWDGLISEPTAFLSDIPRFNQLFAQGGLFVLALGIFLTGAGSVSLDRFLFKGESPNMPEADII